MQVLSFIFIQCSLCISVVYLWSGVSKVIAPENAVKFTKSLGLSASLAHRMIIRILGILEATLAVSIILFSGPIRTFALIFILLLSSLFTFLTIRVVRSGEELQCGCFGDSRKVGASTVWLNILMAFLAVLMLSASGLKDPVSSLILRVDSFSSIFLILIALLLLVYLWPRKGIRESPSASLHNRVIYPAEAVSPHGKTLTLPELYRGSPVLLVFAKHSCIDCRPVLQRIQSLIENHSSPKSLFIVTRSSAQELLDEYPLILGNVLFGPSSMAAALEISMTPAAVVIGMDSQVQDGPVYGRGQVISMVDDFFVMASNKK